MRDTHTRSGQAGAAPGTTAGAAVTGRLRRGLSALWSAVVGVIGVVVGIAPHVLHHVGFLAGTAFIAGAGGTVLFGVLGLAASIPFLLRLRRRFASWWAPTIALVVFAVMFSISSFIIGPAISGDDVEPLDGSRPIPTTGHAGHHTE